MPLPVTLYNMPSLTRTSFELATVRRLLDEPSIVGMKDSSGDLAYFEKVRELSRERDDWSLLVGQEHLLAQALERGADGGVCGGANVWPQLFVQIYEAALATAKPPPPNRATCCRIWWIRPIDWRKSINSAADRSRRRP